MTQSLNYTVPIQNFQLTVLQNGLVVSILPRSSFPKLIIGINSVFNTLPVASNYIDQSHINQWGNFQNDMSLYLEVINPSNAIWRDYGAFNRPWVYFMDPPIVVPVNTQIVAHYANLNSTVLPKLLTTFYVVRAVV